jgi:hypothetical protein
MKLSRRAFAFILICALPAVLGALPPPARPLDITAIIRLATQKVIHTKGYAKASLLRATGTTASGNATTNAADITHWVLVFDNRETPGAVSSGATLTCKNNVLGAVKAAPGPGLGVYDIELLPVLPLATAVSLIRKAGYAGPFDSVELFYVVGAHEHPIYEFNFDDSSIVVDTHTRVVELPTSD